jgi:hypothetical protein
MYRICLAKVLKESIRSETILVRVLKHVSQEKHSMVVEHLRRIFRILAAAMSVSNVLSILSKSHGHIWNGSYLLEQVVNR